MSGKRAKRKRKEEVKSSLEDIEKMRAYLQNKIDDAKQPWSPFILYKKKYMPKKEKEKFIKIYGKEYIEALLSCKIGKYYENNRYRVNIVKHNEELWHLSIRRQDNGTIQSWQELQRIKNELIGEEHEAFQVYPVQEEVVDLANQYHLYCFIKPGSYLPASLCDGDIEEQEARAKYASLNNEKIADKYLTDNNSAHKSSSRQYI